MPRWTLASVIGALGLGACTSMLYPDRLQTVAVNSQPPGASVQVNGTALGTTPVHVQLDRRQSYTVELQKGGYDPYRQVLTKSVDPLFFLNALFIIGFPIDLATGSWQKFPEAVEGYLMPVEATRRQTPR